MSRLTAIEISLRHRVCSQPDCAICSDKSMGAVAHYLNQIGFHVRDFSEDHKTSFAYVEVVEDEETCSCLLNLDSPPRAETRQSFANPIRPLKETSHARSGGSTDQPGAQPESTERTGI